MSKRFLIDAFDKSIDPYELNGQREPQNNTMRLKLHKHIKHSPIVDKMSISN